MISFDEARIIVVSELKPLWNSIGGTFYVAEWGSENKKYWQVPAGAKEFFVDGNFDFQIIDDQVYLVEKETGQFTTIIAYKNLNLLQTFEPYGKAPSFI